jgi:hypothetical protein
MNGSEVACMRAATADDLEHDRRQPHAREQADEERREERDRDDDEVLEREHAA